MHLRSLRLRGFKSFPDQLELVFEPGVAVVVGPNGSGKSNVSDAIVWAAGSLTPSELRAEKPDDVLFAGGADRAPAEHCEVELVFDNEDGGFPELDFSEVSIARRLVRGGEGQYLVNRAAVRRIDLVELLADVGLGGTMHSIVSQGKVDAVLASRPADRRSLVEEAAGLGKFKRRRHRAGLKLARVAAQVERARDVEEEVRKRLRPLALQASAAERAEKLAEEIARLAARVAALDLAAASDRRTVVEERRTAAALARRATQERLSALLEERRRAEDELSDAAGRREAALSALYRLQGAAERVALRREAATGLEARLRDELAEHERAELAAHDDDAVRALEEEARRLAADAHETAQARGHAAERARLAHARLLTCDRAAAAAADARVDALARERSSVEAGLAEARPHGDGAGRRLVALTAARERVALRRESAVALAEGLASDLREARRLAAAAGPTPAELERLADEAAAHARAAATERDDLAERARSAAERLLALDRTLAERVGIPPAARALAEDGERLALASLEVEPGAERAVAAALGHRASAVLAGDAGAGLQLLERARAAGLGSLTVLVGRDPAELVGALPVVALEDLLDARAPAVTAEGFGYDPGRGELWFAGDTAEAVLLEMQARRAALADEADELASRAESAARGAEDAAARAAEAETEFAAVAHLRGRLLDPGRLEPLHAAADRLAGLLRAAAERAADIEGRLADEGAAASARAAGLAEELRGLGELEAEARRDAAAAAERVRRAEVVLARLGATPSDRPSTEADATPDGAALAAEAERALADHAAAEAAAATATERARAAEAALAMRIPRRRSIDADLLVRLRETASVLGAALDRAADLAERLQAPVRARSDAGARRSSELGEELRRLGAAEVELRQSAELASERATEVEVELARVAAEEEELRRRLEASAGVEPAEGDDREELAARAERLEARREALGKVNPLAKEEYEAEKERLDDLAAQRHDLEESLAEVTKLRDDLAETVQRRFEETFAAVAANFEEVAATLFPGGEGRLRLVEAEEDDGEDGVEVELRPAGKRITRLSLLSGGEKALGAISFLFALFLAKPCPFYLLDEVEAALDDTNIARFVDLLRRYADRAQFVVITHQKRTMEAADVLYGVTMGADGVSQVVSRRLPRHEHAAAASA